MFTLAPELASTLVNLDPTGIASTIFSIASKIHEQYGQMQSNQEICQGLEKEVGIINEIVEKLYETEQIGPCQRTLVELKKCLIECLTLIGSIGAQKDTLEKIKSFLSAKDNQEIITKLMNQLHTISDMLNLALTAQTANSVEKIMVLMAKKEAENLPSIQQCNTQINEDVNRLRADIQSITITNAGGQGGSARAEVHVHIPQPIHRNSVFLLGKLHDLKEKSQNEQEKVILRELRQLFMDNRGEKIADKKHEKTGNFSIYNEILERHNASLAYDSTDGVHILYVDYEPVSPKKEVLKKIGGMIEVLNQAALETASSASIDLPQRAVVVRKRRPSGIKNFIKEDERENTLDSLRELRKFFLSERDEGEQSANFYTYEKYLKIAYKNAELIHKANTKKHILCIDGIELDAKASAQAIYQMIERLEPEQKHFSESYMFHQYTQPAKPSPINVSDLKEFLRLVAEGEQDKAEAVLKNNLDLALIPGEVTDLSKRTFTGITGFQYAVWALDCRMWTMIRKYLPDEAAREQAKGFETGFWVKTHGVHANLNNLIQAHQTTTFGDKLVEKLAFRRGAIARAGEPMHARTALITELISKSVKRKAEERGV